MRSVPMSGSFLILVKSIAAVEFASLDALASNCDEGDESLSLLQVRAGHARKFPSIGALAHSIESATSEVFGKGDGTTSTTGICGFTKAETAAKVSSGKVRSYDGEITAEGCLHWCLGETMCRSAVFEPDSSACHVLPESYGKGNKRMLVAGAGAVAADKTCHTKCKLSQPKKGKSAGSELKNLTAETMEQCQAHCLKEKDCLSLVFEAEEKMCSLKSQVADPDAENAADNSEFSNKECHHKCSFKDPVMLESFNGSAPLEHRKDITEMDTCQKACQDRSECHAVLFGQDAANCFLLPATDNDDAASRYFSAGDVVISTKNVCDDHGDIVSSTNSSDELKKLDHDETKDKGEEDAGTEEKAASSDDGGDSENFAAEFKNFEEVKDTDDDLVNILSDDDDDEQDQEETDDQATTSKDANVAELSVDTDVKIEFGNDGKDKVDSNSKVMPGDTKTAYKKKKKEKELSSSTSSFNAKMADFEDDGEDEYGAVFDALGADDQTKMSASASMVSNAEEEVRKAREEDEKEEDEQKEEEGEENQEEEEKKEEEKDEEEKEEKEEEHVEEGEEESEGITDADADEGADEEQAEEDQDDFTDNDEDLANVFEHLDNGHEGAFVDSLGLDKLEHDESDSAKAHHSEKSVEDIRSEVRKARKAEQIHKPHKSRKASSKTVDDEDGGEDDGDDDNNDDDEEGGKEEGGKEAKPSADLDPDMEAQKSALQAILEGKSPQAQEAQQVQQAVSQPQAPLPQMASVSQQQTQQQDAPQPQVQPQLTGQQSEDTENDEGDKPYDLSWLSDAGVDVPNEDVPNQVAENQGAQNQDADSPPPPSLPQLPQQQVAPAPQQPLAPQPAILASAQPQQVATQEPASAILTAEASNDLSWLTDAGVDVPNEDVPNQAAENQGTQNQDADSPPPPSLPQLPQQQVAPAPQQPLAPQPATLASAQPQQVAAQEPAPAVLTAEASKVVQVEGPDGPSVLIGGHSFDGSPVADGGGDVPSAMDLSLKEGSGFSVAFTIYWQEFSPGVHAIDISDKDSHSDILSVSSSADGSALSFSIMRSGTPAELTVSNAFEVGVSARYLCTVGPTGKMQVFRDGTILGRLKPDGSYQDHSPGGSTNPAVPNGQLTLGRATEEQRNSAAKTFSGWLGDICVFPKEVLFGEAVTCMVKAGAASAR